MADERPPRASHQPPAPGAGGGDEDANLHDLMDAFNKAQQAASDAAKKAKDTTDGIAGNMGKEGGAAPIEGMPVTATHPLGGLDGGKPAPKHSGGWVQSVEGGDATPDDVRTRDGTDGSASSRPRLLIGGGVILGLLALLAVAAGVMSGQGSGPTTTRVSATATPLSQPTATAAPQPTATATPTPVPHLNVSPNPVSWPNHCTGPFANAMSVTNGGGGTLNWSAATDTPPGTAQVSPTSGTLSAGASQAISLSGQWGATFHVLFSGAGAQTTVTVNCS